MKDDNEKPTMSAFEIAMKIHDHIADCTEASRKGEMLMGYKVEPIPLQDYVNACKECLPVPELLPEKLLTDRIDSINLSRDDEMLLDFPPGDRCCVTVIPVTPRGSKLEEKAIKSGAYQVRLTVEKDNGTTKGKTLEGYSIEPSYFFHMLPEEIQKQCTFEVPQYDPSDPNGRKKIIDLYTRAYRSAQIYFNGKKEILYS